VMNGICPPAVGTAKRGHLRTDAGDNLAHTNRKTIGEGKGFLA
jgi:hypothetical protein